MGSGKSTTCEKLYRSIEKSCWLDGDWCWTMNPFIASEENKAMVLENIGFLLNNFLKNDSFDYIFFNWVMHEDEIINSVLERLDLQADTEVYKFSLICNERELSRRILKDISKGIRDEESLERSIERIPLYFKMDTLKIDVSDLTVEETVEKIKGVLFSTG